MVGMERSGEGAGSTSAEALVLSHEGVVVYPTNGPFEGESCNGGGRQRVEVRNIYKKSFPSLRCMLHNAMQSTTML